MTIDRNSRILFFFALFAFCFIVMVMRRPDLISNPQFWAEDGAVWYQQAHNLGWFKALLIPQSGYFQTISRLVAAFTLNFSLSSAPLIFNLIGIAIRCSVILFILSKRVSYFSLKTKLVICLFILLMPHLAEVHANITNTHWYISIYLFFILISDNGNSLLWRAHDFLVMIISGLSGPFIVFLAPVLFLKILNKVELTSIKIAMMGFIKRLGFFELSFSAICLVQIVTILASQSGERVTAPLGASLDTLVNIASSRIFLGFITSNQQSVAIWDMQYLNYVVSFLGFSLLAILVIKGDWRAKSCVIFPFLMLCAALARPAISSTLPQWGQMRVGGGERYFVISSIFWLICLLKAVNYFSWRFKSYSELFLLAVVLVSGFFNFKIAPLHDARWDKQVVMYNNTPKGKNIRLDINPTHWKMDLLK